MRRLDTISSAHSSGVLLSLPPCLLIRGPEVSHPRAEQAPDGCGLLVGEPLDELVQCRTSCGRAGRMGLRGDGLVVHKGLLAASDISKPQKFAWMTPHG